MLDVCGSLHARGCADPRAIMLHHLRTGVGRGSTDHDGPASDFPASHEPVGDIGIVAGELSTAAPRRAEDEQGAGRRGSG